MKNFRFRLLFAAAWLCWSFLHAFVLNGFDYEWKNAITDSLASNILLAAASLLVFVTLQFYIPQKNQYGYILALCITLSIIWVFITKAVLMLLINETGEENGFFSRSLPLRFAIGFLVTGCMALISVLWYTLVDQQEADRRKTEAERLSREAELYKLRQQLQPHFLFNSLNSINALISSSPQQARTMIQQLSDFLRGTLKKEEQQWISLNEELQHLQLYLDIEKIRFGHRLSADVRNETGNDQLKLPAMLLQPVLENAIKFGLYNTTGNVTITLEARLVNGNLEVQVTNPYDPETSVPGTGTGFGLSSVQRRLYLLFARHDLLKTMPDKNVFITRLTIPQP